MLLDLVAEEFILHQAGIRIARQQHEILAMQPPEPKKKKQKQK